MPRCFTGTHLVRFLGALARSGAKNSTVPLIRLSVFPINHFLSINWCLGTCCGRHDASLTGMCFLKVQQGGEMNQYELLYAVSTVIIAGFSARIGYTYSGWLGALSGGIIGVAI